MGTRRGDDCREEPIAHADEELANDVADAGD
jgi:hypothetical protein